MGGGDWIQAGGTAAAAIAAFASWRAAATSQAAMIRAAAEQREQARERRVRRIEDAREALSEMMTIWQSHHGKPPREYFNRWNELVLRLRPIATVLTNLDYRTEALVAVLVDSSQGDATKLGRSDSRGRSQPENGIPTCS